MGNANRPLAETSFAVREIEMPQALEGLIVTQLFQFLGNKRQWRQSFKFRRTQCKLNS